MSHSYRRLIGTAGAAAFASMLVLTVPAAMAADEAAPQAAPAATPPATAPMAAKHAEAKAKADPIDARIAELRGRLHITEAQSAQFDAVAKIMRDNREAHDALVKQKRQDEKTMTAVEDLNDYAEISQAHADGVKKLATAFSDLYDSLSDSQKKAADEAFREHKKHMRQARQHEPRD